MPRGLSAELDDGDVVRRLRDVFELVTSLTGWTGAPGRADLVTRRLAEGALDGARDAVVAAIAAADGSEADRGRLSVLLVQICEVRSAVREAALSRRAVALASARGVFERLRPLSTVTSLMERAPAELGRVGFERCLLSKVDRGRWIARAAHVRDDPRLAEAIREAGSRHPRQIDRQLVEAELVRTRKPILVADAQDHPRVHRELVSTSGSLAYVAAPLVAGSSVIGFVHGDTGVGNVVDEFDRELIGVLAEGIGLAVERIVHRERLFSLKQVLASYTGSVLDMVEEMTDGAPTFDEPPVTAPVGVSQPRSERPARNPEVARLLTPRELEVMDLIAAGDTNSRIAARLFVTEATVKAHVKHIFRKLSAANRAEAVSRYYR
ncbi:LuxR C-terminal-related transcriptional regulator [Pseudonocardia endophytica]|uniref:LuxR C-terminal-related transcriptional regulator n=1 Tax=Pseudonocardia endophytica TaxID=401976 RepID=UPI001404F2C7|nr:LuxR C-terminal-related transcriptional regulator [Pseudonocardia endophytica]